MGMKLTLSDFGDVSDDLRKMAGQLAMNGESRVVDKALYKAIKPIYADIKQRASTDPRVRTGNLLSAIETGKPRTSRRNLRRIEAGVFRRKMQTIAYHAHLVEFGHGGPAPAPPHPYVRPAFDAKSEEAFRILREELGKAIDELRK